MNPSIIAGIIGIAVYAAFTMMSYYLGMSRLESVFPANASPETVGIITYFLAIITPLVAYLFFKVKKTDAKISAWAVSGFFLWVVFLTSWMTFAHIDGGAALSSGQRFGFGITLFGQICKYLLFILPLGIVFAGSWRLALEIVWVYEKVPDAIRMPLSIGLGWSAFVLKLAVIGFFGFYNLWAFYGLLAITALVSTRSIWRSLQDFHSHSFDMGGDSYRTMRTCINAFLIVVLFVVISTNIANIVRPYPIGWDDLGVYMNFPKLIAFSESTSNMGMILWQSFTGIGFMHKSATLAFFLNEFGSALAIMGIWAGIRFFSKRNHPIVSLPLLATTIFMGLPMIVFQQAKDMKLDPGLLGISTLAIVSLFMALEENEEKSRNVLYVIAGALIGIAFSIKITTLMIIIGGLAVLFYKKIGLAGFFGFLCIFTGTFTSLRLWDFMNVNYPKAYEHLTAFGMGFVFLGVGLCLGSIYLKKVQFGTFLKTLGLPVLLVAAGCLVTIGPWVAKNAIEGVKSGQMNVNVLIGGDSKGFTPDYSKILSKDQLSEIDERNAKNSISSDGKTTNEDMGRYFWYESGLNNYLKLPVNLTLQTNQKGEFTDISYIFLALLPGALLLRFRKKTMLSAYGALLGGLFILYFCKVPALSAFLGNIQLPLGYIAIISVILCPLVALHIDAKSDVPEEDDGRFLSFFAFMSVYVLLFAIAAFGIVWYGILMYFGFLAIIAMCVNSTRFTELQKTILGMVAIIVVFPYFVFSVIPHAWNNLPEDGLEYKIGKMTEFEGVFQNRPEYIRVLSKFNLKDSSKVAKKVRDSITNPDLKKIFENYPNADVNDTLALLDMAQKLGAEKPTAQYQAIALEARSLKGMAFEEILYPSTDNRNTEKVYRMGTFLTYYVTQNRTRFYDDSLINAFETYFKGKTREATAENLTKLGIKYMLVDLNAATIDQDPRHDLTRRYEQVLDFIKTDKVKLVATDSLCLQVALDLKTNDNYMNLAGTNYVSYLKDENGNTRGISPTEKVNFCAKVIGQIISENRVTEKDFSYLQPLAEYVVSKKPQNENDYVQLITPYISRTWMAAFEIQP